ncbi:hypothetical protein [Leptospira levettii]|uniref:hypothetical protein n=1 Tax=Leptospira levettii TaxID=2023178 RepID=UPI003EBD560D
MKIQVYFPGFSCSIQDELVVPEFNLRIRQNVSPTLIPDHWKEWLGIITLTLIQKSPIVLEWDHVGERSYEDEIQLFYLGLYVTKQLSCDPYPIGIKFCIEADGSYRVNGHFHGYKFQFQKGNHNIAFDKDDLKKTVTYYKLLKNLRTSYSQSRVTRAIGLFQKLISEADAIERLHITVRIVEAFLSMTHNSKKLEKATGQNLFLKRILQFVSNFNETDLRECYQIRSNISHMNSLHDQVSECYWTTDKINQTLFRMEGLVRYLIQNILNHPEILPEFLGEELPFWSKSEENRNSIWKFSKFDWDGCKLGVL